MATKAFFDQMFGNVVHLESGAIINNGKSYLVEEDGDQVKISPAAGNEGYPVKQHTTFVLGPLNNYKSVYVTEDTIRPGPYRLCHQISNATGFLMKAVVLTIPPLNLVILQQRLNEKFKSN